MNYKETYKNKQIKIWNIKGGHKDHINSFNGMDVFPVLVIHIRG